MALAGITSVDYALTKNTGRLAHAHSLLRRLGQSRGGLLGSPTYGYDLQDAIGSSVVRQVVEQRVREQMLYDERTYDAAVSVTFENGQLNGTIDIQGSEGPFLLEVSGSNPLTAKLIIDGNPAFWGNL